MEGLNINEEKMNIAAEERVVENSAPTIKESAEEKSNSVSEETTVAVSNSESEESAAVASNSVHRRYKLAPLAAFGTAFLIFAVTIIPYLIKNKGIWIYYGDFNVQQIPFYVHLHDVIRSGNIWYDWGTDLGGSVLGCYSFYILGSPFFWLTLPFGSDTVVYLMPWINAVKYGVMALSAFLWLRRNTKSDTGAYIGALLYAFSGYSGAVLVYNHFHDVMAFFPLWLLLFDRMMEEKKRAAFIFMTAFMAILNYYFFVGEVVFIVIYFFCRHFSFKKLLRAIVCGGLGVICALWYLVPAVAYTVGNSRLSDTLLGNSLVAYDEPVMLMGIIKNVMLLPDLSGLNSMFNASYSRVSGVGAYLPLVSLGAVIAYFILYKKKDLSIGDKWPKRVMVTSAIFAVIPGLNALFSAMNSEYYARWYFMPILVMSLMSARVLECAPGNREVRSSLAKGNLAVAISVIFFCVCAVLPAVDSDGKRTILGAIKSPEQLLSELVFSIIMTCLFFVLILVIPRLKRMRLITAFVLVGCFVTHATMFVTGEFLIDMDRKSSFIEQGIKGREATVLPNEDVWCRIETEQDVYNYPMIWNRPSITAFISTVPSSTIDFYKGQGLTRKVTSKLGVTRGGARTVLCGRYLLVETKTPIERIGRVEDKDELNLFTLLGETNGFEIYENNYFVPMGIVFDEYITEENYEASKASTATLDRALMKTLILNDETAQKYGYLLSEVDELKNIPLSIFASECDERREGACDSFETTKRGFNAHIEMDRDNLILFAVPYDSGFKAYVDGVETDIISVDYGLCAIYAEAGEHDIEFKYSYLNIFKKLVKEKSF